MRRSDPGMGMRLTVLMLGGLALLQAARAHGAHLGRIEPSPCNFSSYIRHKQATSWEFQLDVPPDKCNGIDRCAQLRSVQAAIANLANNGTDFYPHTLRTSVMYQVSTALTTTDGRPLFPSKKSPSKLPWSGPAFIRHRRKLKRTRGMDEECYPHLNDNFTKKNSEIGAVRTNEGDLTLKVKDVDVEKFVPLHQRLHFPYIARRCGRTQKSSRLPRRKWKIENDRYCAIGRASYEVMVRPVSLKIGSVMSLERSVHRCFPGMWSYLGYDRSAVLPEYNRRAFSKSVWDVHMGGVSGVVNWVASYANELDALTGSSTALECELSFRVKRGNARTKNELENALTKVVWVSESLHAGGWDTGVHGSRSTSANATS